MKIIIRIITTLLYIVWLIIYNVWHLFWYFEFYKLRKVTVDENDRLKSNYYYVPHKDFLYKNMFCYIWKIKTPYHEIHKPQNKNS